MEEQERLARLGRAPQPTSSADTGGTGRSTDDEQEVDRRQKESLLVLKAKQLQEVGGRHDPLRQHTLAGRSPEQSATGYGAGHWQAGQATCRSRSGLHSWNPLSWNAGCKWGVQRTLLLRCLPHASFATQPRFVGKPAGGHPGRVKGAGDGATS